MSDTKPLSDKRLEEIERHLGEANLKIGRNCDEPVDILRYVRDVTALLADNEHLRAQMAQERLLHARMVPIIRNFARFGIGGFMPAYHVDEAVAIVKALEQMERERDALLGEQPRTLIEGGQFVDEHGETHPIIVRLPREDEP